MDQLDALYDAALAGDAHAIAKLKMEADIVNEDEETILHVESQNGNIERVRFILREFADKNLLPKQTADVCTALHLAIYGEHTEVAGLLIDAAKRQLPETLFQAFLRQHDVDMDTALHTAVWRNRLDIVKLLVEADPIGIHIKNSQGKTPIYIAAERGYTDIAKVICSTYIAVIMDGPGGSTVLHAASKNLDHGIEVVEVVLRAARLLYSSSDHYEKYDTHSTLSSFQAFLRQVDYDLNTALHIAVMQAQLPIVKLLVEADPTDKHTQNKKGETPIYTAVQKGFYDIVKVICTTCTAPTLDGPGGTTALLAAIKNLDQAKKEDQEVIRMIIDSVKDAKIARHIVLKNLSDLFSKTDECKQTILELAVEKNLVDVVKMILVEDDSYQNLISFHYIDLMPLIYKARDKEYTDIDELLTERYEAGAQAGGTEIPLFKLPSTELLLIRNWMGFLISYITRRMTESVLCLLEYNAEHLVAFTDKLGWTALHHAVYHEFDNVVEAILKEQKKFGHPFIYEDMLSTPFHVAAEKGYTSTMICLMKFWPASSSAYNASDKYGRNILHLAALESKKEMIQGILKYCQEEYMNEIVNKQDNNGNTPLHLLIQNGCFVPELFKYRELDIWKKNKENRTPPDMLYFEDQIINDQVQIKLALDKIQMDHEMNIFSTLVLPSKRKTKDVILERQAILMKHEKNARMKDDIERYKKTRAMTNWFADAIAGDTNARFALEMEADTLNEKGETILHIESMKGDTEHVRYIVGEFTNTNLLVKLDRLKQTALHLAAHHGHSQVVEVLVDAARNLPSSLDNDDTRNPVSSFQNFIRQATGSMGNTALHLAVNSGNLDIVKLLVEADTSDRHIPNYEGKTPIYIAAEKGYNGIIKMMCTTCTALCLDGPGGNTTALHAAILNIHQAKEEDRDVIRKMIDAAKCWTGAEDAPNVSVEKLFKRTDTSGRTVLELAVDMNHADTVELILLKNPVYQHGSGSKNGLMRLIYKAIDNEYMDIVKLLSETYEAGVTTAHKGVVALILAIYRRDEDTVIGLLRDAKHLVTFADDEGWTPLHYAAYHEFVSILDVIINSLKDVDYQFVYGDKVSTPFHVAAGCKYTYTVIQLMRSWPAYSSAYTAIDKNGQNILHLAATNNMKKMIQGILKYCPEKYKDEILEQKDAKGDTPLHLLISNGCFIPELMKHKGLDTMAKNKKNFTPRDMLYLKEDVIGDQVKIKMELDNVETNQSWKFWGKRTEKKTDISKSLVLPSRREIKDVKFNEQKKLLIDAKHGQMKKDLERYKKRTNTQIIVTALITTVTFTVGFTMPGGLHQSGEVDEGLVVLSRKTAFNAFMVSDALALLLSMSSLFFYFLESMNEDPDQVSKLNAASTVLNIVSVMAMMLTFIAGTYVVLSHSPALAIAVCVISSLFFLLIIVLLIKMVCDRQVKRNEN